VSKFLHLLIENCGQCPFAGDQKSCRKTGREVELDTLPADCPLPDDRRNRIRGGKSTIGAST